MRTTRQRQPASLSIPSSQAGQTASEIQNVDNFTLRATLCGIGSCDAAALPENRILPAEARQRVCCGHRSQETIAMMSWLCAIAILSGPVPPPENAMPNDLVGFLLAQNEASRARLAAVQYDFEYTRDFYVTTRGPVHGQGEGRIVVEGQNRFAQLHRLTRLKGPLGGEDPVSESIDRWVLNDHLFAFWSEGPSPIQVHDHESISTMSDAARRMMRGARGPDVFVWAFGNGDEPLRASIESDGPGVEWTARRIVGERGVKFELICFSPLVAEPAIPTLVIELDPAQAFLVTRVTAHGVAR